jgi:hypothetical protein
MVFVDFIWFPDTAVHIAVFYPYALFLAVFNDTDKYFVGIFFALNQMLAGVA